MQNTVKYSVNREKTKKGQINANEGKQRKPSLANSVTCGGIVTSAETVSRENAQGRKNAKHHERASVICEAVSLE